MATSPTSDLTWVTRTMTVAADDPAKDAIEANAGWRLLHVGAGSAGQTTLTYGWPWPEGKEACIACGAEADEEHSSTLHKAYEQGWR